MNRDEVNNVDLEREIDKLSSSGVKNRTQTLTLSRLMVRAEDLQPRKNILNVLRKADQACRRLFLDYHGLKLLWGWMVDAASAGQNPENIEFKMDLLKTLSSLPVPNKTMLLDSKILSIVEKWAIPIEAPSSTAAAVPVVKKEETSEDPTDAVKDEVTDSVVIKQDPDDPPRQEPANPTQEPVAPADTNTAEAPSDKEDVEKVRVGTNREDAKLNHRLLFIPGGNDGFAVVGILVKPQGSIPDPQEGAVREDEGARTGSGRALHRAFGSRPGRASSATGSEQL